MKPLFATSALATPFALTCCLPIAAVSGIVTWIVNASVASAFTLPRRHTWEGRIPGRYRICVEVVGAHATLETL